MFSRKIKNAFVFSSLFISLNVFGQELLGLGGGIGSLDYFHNNKASTTPDSNLSIGSHYSPRVFLSWAFPFGKKIYLEINLDVSDKQTMSNKFWEYNLSMAYPGITYHNCTYHILYSQVGFYLTYPIQIKKSQLLFGIGPFVKLNLSTSTDSSYTLPNGKGGDAGSCLTPPFCKGFAFQSSYDIHLNDRFYLSPQLLYRLNLWNFGNIRGFHEFYFSIGIKIKMRDRSSTADQSPLN